MEKKKRKESISKRLKWMKMEECTVYPDAAGHAVNFEPHDGYAQWNTREDMKELLIWTSDGVPC